MINAGRGEFFVRLCRARASTQTHHMNMHTRSAMQVAAARICIHEGGESTGRQRRPCRAAVKRCAVAILADSSLRQRTLCASDTASGRPRHAKGHSHGDSELSFGVSCKPAAYRTGSISESAACGLRTTGTVSTATSMTRLACLAPQGGPTQIHDAPRAPHAS